MSAGDLVNNLGKLELKLKQVNFRNFRRSELLSGTLDIYVSIYGYVFSNFNRELSKLIASHELELYGKTSKRFVDNLYLIVRDILHYKPPITKNMFLTNCGFVEMKMIMCTQILELVLAKCKELPSSDIKNKKNCRKPGYFSSSTPGNNGKKNTNIKNVSTNRHTDDYSKNANNVIVTTNSAISDSKTIEASVFMLPSMQHKISTIQAIEKKLNSVTKSENTGKTTTAKPNKLFSSCRRHHLPSNYFKLADGRVSSEIPRHSISNDCANTKNPVSKCNVARSSYSKGKAVVLEKQEPPPQKVDIKVLKGPLQINDGYFGVPRIIPPEELSSRNVSFCQNSFPSTRRSVSSKPPKTTEQSTNATTTIPRSTKNAVTITTPRPEGALLTFLTSSTITKPRKVRPATTIPISTSTTKLKCPPKDTAPTESKFVENTTVTMLKPLYENNQPKGINSLTSSSSYGVGITKVADAQNLKASHGERTHQVKNLSQNLTGCVETLRKMQERSQQWDTQNAFLNCSEQNKENALTLSKETIPTRLGCEIRQESVGLSKTKESEDQIHQLDHWIAKMNLMECAVKSLESKFKSL